MSGDSTVVLWALGLALLTSQLGHAAARPHPPHATATSQPALSSFVTALSMQAMGEAWVDVHQDRPFVQLHPRGGLSYTPAEVAAWPAGTIVYIKADLVAAFAASLLPALTSQVIFLLGVSDTTPPTPALTALLDTNSTVWCVNCPVSYRHARLFHFPLGVNAAVGPGAKWGMPAVLDAWYQRTYSTGLLDFTTVMAAKQDKLFVPPISATHPSRQAVQQWVHANRHQPWLATPPKQWWHWFVKHTLSFEDYLGQLSQYRWALCPRGNGIDIHRFWEAALVGTTCIYVSDDDAPGAVLDHFEGQAWALLGTGGLDSIPGLMQQHQAGSLTELLWRGRERLLSKHWDDAILQRQRSLR